MLDFPELFAPARIVNGRISIAHSSAIDLKPFTAILVMPSIVFFRHVGTISNIHAINHAINRLPDRPFFGRT